MNNKTIIIALLTIVAVVTGCSSKKQMIEPADFVDPFIGTAAHGHTFPGSTVPFALVQVSPDTGTQGWDWCSGYHSSDNSIMGFSHSHLSGTGGSDLGDILFMPSARAEFFVSGEKNDTVISGYRSHFKKENEKAGAGYYSVILDDNNVKVELTSTERAAMHRYVFSKHENQHVVIDLGHGIQDNTKKSYIRKVNDYTVEGFRTSTGWADEHTVYFYAKFSNKISRLVSKIPGGTTEDLQLVADDISAVVSFEKAVDTLHVKVGISYVDCTGAKQNVETEIADNTFDQVRQNAYNQWNDVLKKVEVKGSDDDKIIFYTALYHSMIAPYVMSDVDGRYIGPDRKHHTIEGENAYGLFSLWDTFRALHPLLTVIDPAKNQEFVRSLVRYYDQRGRLPVWDLNMRENNCMIGYHAVPVIVDAYMKGQRDFDIDKAMEAMIHSASQEDYSGLKYYRQFGFLPSDKENNAVSKALEYSYDDWCIAMMAKDMGNEEIYNEYIRRAQFYKNHFDSKDGFMKGRNSQGEFRVPFSPTEISILGQGDFTEGSSWHYSFFVPQDINTHIEMMGGDKAYSAKLDELFNSETVTAEHSPDVTGLIGNYAQGNEPSHHVIYMYNYIGEAWKTQHMISRIKNEMYSSARDGLCGNEDCGQMSAWYAFSAMGFYPVTPASNVYAIGTPTFEQMTINLQNGKKFSIKAKNLSKDNYYIQSATMNGKPYPKSYITHQDIENGSEIVFVMGSKPNKQWGAAIQDRPVADIQNGMTADDILSTVVFEPFLDVKERVFSGDITVEMETVAGNDIRYNFGTKQPTIRSTKATKPLTIKDDKVLSIRSFGKDGQPSSVGVHKFYKGRLKGGKITGTAPAEPYVNGGLASLNDGLLGGENYKNAEWIGYVGQTATLQAEFPIAREIRSVGFNAINSTGAWLFLPFEASATLYNNGKMVKKIAFKVPNARTSPEGAYYIGDKFSPLITDKIVWEIVGGTIPEWHTSKGNKAWMFIDELMAY